MRLASSVLQVSAPPIPRAKKWGQDFAKTSSRPLLDLSQGAPGSPPPEVLREAIATAALDPQNSSYGHHLGNSALREVMAKETKVVYGEAADVCSEDIGICMGCNMAFSAAIMTLAQHGDEVILPVPWYFNHEMTMQMLGITIVPVPLQPELGFHPSVEDCEKLITSRTKAIVLVSPNNPTGAIYPPTLIASFGRLAAMHNIALILDETYRDLITDGQPPHTLFDPADNWNWREHFIQLFSFSKSYAIPGHRLGSIVASPYVLGQIGIVLDCLQICPSLPVQAALPPLVPSLRTSFIRETALALESRHSLFRSVIPARWIIGSSGTYFAFVKHPFESIPADVVCEALAKEVGVIILPATFFSPSGDQTFDRWMRIAVANVDDDKIKELAIRLKEFEELHGDWLA